MPPSAFSTDDKSCSSFSPPSSSTSSGSSSFTSSSSSGRLRGPTTTMASPSPVKATTETTASPAAPYDAAVGDCPLRRHNVRVIGTGKTTLLLSHGFGTNQKIWDGMLSHLDLQHSFRVVLWDLMGAFSTPAESYDFQRYGSLCSHADDLLEVLEELREQGKLGDGGGAEDDDDVVCVGHSVSGMVSLLASLERPSAFRRLLLLGSSPRYLNDPPTGYIGGFNPPDLDQIFLAVRENYIAWVSGFAPLMVGRDISSREVREFSETMLQVRPDIALSTLRTAFQSDFRHLLGRVSCPVTVLSTGADAAVPVQVSEYLREAIPGACMEVLPTQGHLPHLTHPAVVAHAIQRHASVPQ
ncbi:unnamed protein product [Closterium sp. NIES-64]|nr:unnamed protein product [Closterium sp. NIES-64]